MGDGALMEFASVVDAVRFAIEVQCAMRERNTGVPDDRRVLYRIGINIGDIIVEDEDIYGDGERMALPLPDKPSITVLPFNNFSTDPEQGYFADGMTEDMITDLSKLSGIFVIARNSSWTYKDKPTKLQHYGAWYGPSQVAAGRAQGHPLDVATPEQKWPRPFGCGSFLVPSLFS
jgi:hypothetical protein